MNHYARTRSRIKLLKYIFLSLGCCVMVSIMVTLYLKNSQISEEITETSSKNKHSKLSKDYSLSIKKSTFEGISHDLTPYKILANTVTKNLDNQYILSEIKGTYGIGEENLIIKSSSGILNEDSKMFILKDDVNVTINDMHINSKKLYFNLSNKDAHSDSEVEINSKNAKIKADSFYIKDSNNIINFEGNVDCTFDISDFE